ncbi:MAG TPA: hypothetical protein VGN13_12375 [Solirubrobacteraceae bacterium]|jgi:ABC-type glycerol-3-phosphate transport system substrate-binding protein
MVRRWIAPGIAALALAGCGSSSSPSEASYKVWQNGCKTLTTFTRAEVIQTWGSGAIVNGELRGGPAAINKECGGA